MGLRQSKQVNEKALKDTIKEELLEELTLNTLTALSAELNHRLFEVEKTLGERIARAEEHISDINKTVKLINSSVTLQSQELELLHRTKKTKPSLCTKGS